MNASLWPLLWAAMSGIPTGDDAPNRAARGAAAQNATRRRNRDGVRPVTEAAPETPEAIKVLVVDDDPDICELVCARLKIENGGKWQTCCAHSLTDALVCMADCKPDVILLDLCLGDSVGLATLERVARVSGAAAIIVMSAMEENETAPPAIMEGAQDFISKPEIDVNELPARICRALESRRLLERIKARNELSHNETTGETYGACHV
jgi:DNA-binding NtrC family response regulator